MRKAQQRDHLLNPKVSLKSCNLHTQLTMLLPHTVAVHCSAKMLSNHNVCLCSAS